ncbi:MAG: DUF357 domain-containing protein [Nanoarchaeota archaeon]|nr:DUF357 domain-containing protein [Nanoarchaeota archaeon]
MNIKVAAEREMKRMEEIFNNIKISNNKKADEFYSFAENYFMDGKYFFGKKKYIESFEAFIISWAYLDIGLKLKLFKVDKSVKKYFTS